MKKLTILFLTFAILASFSLTAQMAVTTDGSSADASAMLEVKSTAKGFLPPRMGEMQRDDISSPATGLVVWCTNCGDNGELQVYNGTEWTNMIGGAVSPWEPIGELHEGGIVCYVFQSGDPGYIEGEYHGLICAIEDQIEGGETQWYNGTNMVTGATGTAIGTGQANTTTIINIQGTGTYAATVCADYLHGGYSDWFLPSLDEIHQICYHKTAINATATANSGDIFTDSYWSSSEYNIDRAWYKNGGGACYQNNYIKNSGYKIRAVRAF